MWLTLKTLTLLTQLLTLPTGSKTTLNNRKLTTMECTTSYMNNSNRAYITNYKFVVSEESHKEITKLFNETKSNSQLVKNALCQHVKVTGTEDAYSYMTTHRQVK